MTFFILALSIFFLIDCTNGSCGDCQPNFVACNSENTFSVCIDGIPNADEVLNCPPGRVCTDQPTICIANTNSSFKASCGKGCEVCNSHDKVFSCLGKKEVGFCFGEKFMSSYSAIAICPEGYVCDLSSREICVRKEYSEGSCDKDYNSSFPSTSTGLPVIAVTTTPRPYRDAETFCRENAMDGTFPKEGDRTCKAYYICQSISNGSKYKGYSYTCSENDFFDPDKRFCTRTRPSKC